ncbi:MAG TPA: CAP domain-containing protein [Bacteroidia bacterium]
MSLFQSVIAFGLSVFILSAVAPVSLDSSSDSSQSGGITLVNYCTNIEKCIKEKSFSKAANLLKSAIAEHGKDAKLMELKKKWIEADYRNNVINSQSIKKQYDRLPDTKKCDPGQLSNESLTYILERLKYYRRLAGVNDSCKFDINLNKKAQSAALMMEANQKLSHAPGRQWKCYNKDGEIAASKSNLSLGYGSVDALTGQITDDGAGNQACGHRRWILNPLNRVFGLGSTDDAMCLYVIDTDLNQRTSKDTHPVMWPSADYFPLKLAPNRWSFSLSDADFTKANVTVMKGKANVPLKKESVFIGYAMNTLVWQMNGNQDAGQTYDVKINNVIVVNDRGKRVQKTFTYKVMLLDIK